MERDVEVNQALSDTGWKVIRIWDFEIKDDVDRAAAKVEAEVRTRRSAL
jgi:very-short-patch-repair endonuclease